MCRFDNVYVDSELRVAKDSRGDTLVVGRVGPPRMYGDEGLKTAAQT